MSLRHLLTRIKVKNIQSIYGVGVKESNLTCQRTLTLALSICWSQMLGGSSSFTPLILEHVLMMLSRLFYPAAQGWK